MIKSLQNFFLIFVNYANRKKINSTSDTHTHTLTHKLEAFCSCLNLTCLWGLGGGGKAVSFIFWKYPYFFALCPPFFKLWLANLFLSLFYSIDVWSCVASIQLLIIYIHICIGNVCNFLKISYFTLWAFWSGLKLMSF